QGSLANGGGLDLAPPGAVDAGANRRSAGVIEEWVAPGKKATVWPPAFAERPVEALPLSQYESAALLMLRRLGAAAGAGMVLVVLAAPPAEAHTVTGVSP